MGKSLMTQKVKYDELESTYKSFMYPKLKLKVGGTLLEEDEINNIKEWHLQLTCSNHEMNLFSFDVRTDYQEEGNILADNLITQFTMGKSIEAEIGYDTETRALFKGYIYETGFEIDAEEDRLEINVICKDFKSLLFNKCGDSKRSGANRAEEIKKILKDSKYSKYGKLASGQESNISDMIQIYSKYKYEGKGQEQYDPLSTEFEKVVALADYYDYEFFVVYDEVYFRPAYDTSESELMTIKGGKYIKSIRSKSNAGQALKSVEVRAFNTEEMKTISVIQNASISSSFIADENVAGSRVIYDERAETEKEAKDLATRLLAQNKWQGQEIELVTIGMPDMVPGRIIELQDIATSVNKQIYIKEVKHSCSEDEGFNTTIRGVMKRNG